MKHYYCPAECEGVSKEPGVCQAENCSRKGMPGLECNCENEDHIGRLGNHDHPESSPQEG